MDPSLFEPMRVTSANLHVLAWAHLNRNGDVPDDVRRGVPFHGLPRLRLWSDPGGMAWQVEPTTLTVFELFTSTYERRPVVRESIWQRTLDLGRLQTSVETSGTSVALKPTVIDRYAPVPTKHLSELLRQASGFLIPVTWQDETESVTSDVGSVGFEFFSRHQPPAGLRLEWSFDVPPEWRQVLAWHDRMRRLLEECFATPP